MSDSICPNCSTKIKSGILGSNVLLSNEENELISIVNGLPLKEHCQKCGIADYSTSLTSFTQKVKEVKSQILSELQHIPVVTIHSPVNWDYDVKGIVSARANLGTGVFTELSTSVSDFFGMESSAYNDKIIEGENKCMDQMRIQAFNKGANAILGTQVSYSEIGTLKGLVLVCTVGTAVKITNTSVLGTAGKNAIETISRLSAQLESWTAKVPGILQDIKLQAV